MEKYMTFRVVFVNDVLVTFPGIVDVVSQKHNDALIDSNGEKIILNRDNVLYMHSYEEEESPGGGGA